LPPLIAHTHSGIGASRVEYVFAYSRDLNTTTRVSFSPRELGYTGDVYVYDYFDRSGQRQPAAQKIETSVDSQGSYFVIAPVGSSQIAFLGDLSKFVPASTLRMPTLLDDGRITLALRFESGETVSLWLSALSAPSVSADGATISAVKFDSGTGLYQITVSAGPSEQAIVRIAPGPAQ
jgi:hypothetical protein